MPLLHEKFPLLTTLNLRSVPTGLTPKFLDLLCSEPTENQKEEGVSLQYLPNLTYLDVRNCGFPMEAWERFCTKRKNLDQIKMLRLSHYPPEGEAGPVLNEALTPGK